MGLIPEKSVNLGFTSELYADSLEIVAEGVGVEAMRYRCGELMKQYDEGINLDYVAGIPDYHIYVLCVDSDASGGTADARRCSLRDH